MQALRDFNSFIVNFQAKDAGRSMNYDLKLALHSIYPVWPKNDALPKF